MSSLQAFLKSKPLYYDKIDLARMPRAFEAVRDHLNLGEMIQVVGTNGKGSTGRMLATLLQKSGAHVGHYTSPHILRFNERVWIDGADADDARLDAAHEKLMGWLSPAMAESLSYFEYTTLLALVAFEGCDYVVLEAGLGGEFDATSVVPKSLSVVTPIGIDHQAFLGETITQIAATKLRSIDKRAVLAKQPEAAVLDVAKEIAGEKGAQLYFAEKLVPEQIQKALFDTARARGWPPFLAQNAVTAWAAASLLLGHLPDASILRQVELRGRFERIGPNVLLDVGHNELAARAIAEALKGQKRVLVYNALSDKDASAILSILSPVVSRLQIIPIESDRAMAPSELMAAAVDAGLPTEPFKGIDPNENYLVFGSFTVAEAFLKHLRSERR
jgi:dihydrofolate synthase/folylpolyglutamate synthase